MTATASDRVPGAPLARGGDPENRRADRFMTAWKRIEGVLKDKWLQEHPTVPERDAPDIAVLLRWAASRHLVPPATEDFLHSCRHARNAYAHVAFPGYSGPVTLPPEPVVLRVERIAHSLSHPVLAHKVAVAAVVCDHDAPLFKALHEMVGTRLLAAALPPPRARVVAGDA